MSCNKDEYPKAWHGEAKDILDMFPSREDMQSESITTNRVVKPYRNTDEIVERIEFLYDKLSTEVGDRMIEHIKMYLDAVAKDNHNA